MRDSLFKNYSEKHMHFYDEQVSVLLKMGLVLARDFARKPRIVDLGCGDGRLTFALYKRGLLNDADEVFGVDVSGSRVERLAKELPFVKCIVSDALHVKELSRFSFDYIICSQLIEHVEDDKRLMLEIRRLLKAGGLLYLSSVIKKGHSMYFYFSDGSFKLDPTHLREYSSVDEFVGIVASNGFEIIYLKTGQIMFPLLDLFLRLSIKTGLCRGDSRFYQLHKGFRKMRGLRVPVFGYSGIEVLARKIE
jgi:SAM-dependent methyltransferase